MNFSKIKTKNLPKGRSRHEYHNYYNKLIVLGGDTLGTIETDSDCEENCEIYILDLKTKEWVYIESENNPTELTGHSSVLYNNSIYTFGGLSEDSNRKKDIFKYNILENKWEDLEYSGYFPGLFGHTVNFSSKFFVMYHWPYDLYLCNYLFNIIGRIIHY
jgi:N-acetylneuraminic acid mutarotase